MLQNKKLLRAISASVILIFLIIITAFLLSRMGNRGDDNQTTYISETDARNIALSDAGCSETEINDLNIILKDEEPAAIYVVTFTTTDYSYEYRINAVDGSSLERDITEIP